MRLKDEDIESLLVLAGESPAWAKAKGFEVNIKVISDILLAWILALPLAVIISAGIYSVLK